MSPVAPSSTSSSTTSIDRLFATAVLRFLDPVREHLADVTVSEILINGHEEVWVERHGRLERSEARFETPEALLAAITCVAQYAGRPLGPHLPIVEARLPDGSRVQAVLPPVSRRGPTVAIRRFPPGSVTAGRWLETGSLDQAAYDLLSHAVLARKNVLIAGGTGSGKTSLLGALAAFIPEDQRIVVIEDCSELRLAQPHVVYLETRPPGPRGEGEVTIRALLRATLRLRPDRIVLGEIRGGEALDLIGAMTSGHGGGLSTIHASRPADALRRLETLALMSDLDLPLEALRAQVGSAVDLVVQVDRIEDGSRRVTQIAQCEGYRPAQGYLLTDRFALGKGAPGEGP